MNKYLVVGQGSMGKRRVRCLLANGVEAERIVVFDTRTDRLRDSHENYGVHTTGDFGKAIEDPRMAGIIVSVPGALHIEYCLAAVRKGKHWFCEVPLSTTSRDLDELARSTSRMGLVGAPGCQILFHPLGRTLKEWTEGGAGGAILAASYRFGSYLPDWHPHEDYRKFYASDKAMGGGNLDVIAQELLWIRWVVGRRIESITCRMSKTSQLQLAEGTPDHQELIVEFEGGLMLSAHFDLMDHTHERLLRLITARATVQWDNVEKAIEVYENTEKKWKRYPQPDGYEYEACYKEEIGRFIQCVERKERWPIDIALAAEIVKVIEALDISDRLGKKVMIKGGPV